MPRTSFRLTVPLLALLILTACVPAGVLRPPSGDQLAPHVITADQLAQQTPVPTRIQSGDTLRIVRDAQENSRTDVRQNYEDPQNLNYVVRSDGSIAFRWAGRVQAAGLTPEALAEALRQKLEVHYREPGVTVNIVASPSSKVVIGGAVRNPSTLDVASVSNLEQALFAVGGLQTGADPARVALLRLDAQDRYVVQFIDFTDVLQPGKVGRAAIALQRGDIVFVPKSTAGVAADAVDLYLNQLLPFSRSLGVSFNRDISNSRLNSGTP